MAIHQAVLTVEPVAFDKKVCRVRHRWLFSFGHDGIAYHVCQYCDCRQVTLPTPDHVDLINQSWLYQLNLGPVRVIG